MDEADYWLALEYRLDRVDKHGRKFWCDGFIPEDYYLDDMHPRITGRVWICRDKQVEWKFILLLPAPVSSRNEIDWASLLPSATIASWMSFDDAGKRLEVDPRRVIGPARQPQQRMTADDFWVGLIYRVTRELAQMRDKRLWSFWCDGFYPDKYLLDDERPKITGAAEICYNEGQELWDFTLLIDEANIANREIAWDALLPPDNVTRWLSLDKARRHIEIDLAAAIPDDSVP